jgi:hypothetical protein
MRIHITLIFLCFSCSTTKKNIETQSSLCNENLKFKIEFFNRIKIIEDYVRLESTTVFNNLDEYGHIMTDEKKKKYDLSLKFISKYTRVSFESMANYNRSYPIGIYENDKNGWRKWYEENKCNNIQFK